MSPEGPSGSKKLHNFELPRLKWQTVNHPRKSRSNKTMRSPRHGPSPPAIVAAPRQSLPINSSVQSSLHAVSASSRSSSPFIRGFVSEMEASCIDLTKNRLSNGEKIVENEYEKVGKLLSNSEKLAQNLSEKMEETVVVCGLPVCGGQRKPKESEQMKPFSRGSRTSSEAGMAKGREQPLILNDERNQLVKEDEGKSISLLQKDVEVNLSIKDGKTEIGGADDKRGKRWNFRERRSSTASEKLTAGSSSMAADSKEPKPVGKNGVEEKQNDEGEMPYFAKLPSFSVQLKPEEIGADLLAMTGKMPSRKPKKRSKNIQRQIDVIIPGSNLGSITMDRYRVSENTPKGK